MKMKLGNNMFTMAIGAVLFAVLVYPGGGAVSSLTPALTSNFTPTLTSSMLTPNFTSNFTSNFTALHGLSPALNDSTQDVDLLTHLPAHATVHVANWSESFIPADCYAQATQYFNLSAADIQVRDVHYDDCTVPWVLCRHREASVSWQEMQDMFGHIPAGMRSYVRHLLLVPDPSHTHLVDWELGSTLMFHDSLYALSAMVHEASHALDAFARRDLAPAGTRLSATQAWSDAWGHDTALPSHYAEISPVEAFAEAGRLAMLDMVVPGGGLDRYGDWAGVRNQVAAYKDMLAGVIFQDGDDRAGLCLSRRPSSQVLYKKDGSPLTMSTNEKRGGVKKEPWLA